jgi:hypothetical protein
VTVRISGSCHRVALSFDVDPDLVDRVTVALPPGWVAGPVAADTPCWDVRTPHDIPSAINAAELYMAEVMPGLVVVHAGVVAFDGSAIVVPGRSLSGKSTLTDALVAVGGTYYSDEFALLDPAGRVYPYPRSITLRASQSEMARVIPAAALPDVGIAPARVGLVAHLRYEPAAEWTVAEVGGGAGTLALIDNAVAARSRPDEVLAHCARAAREARIVQGVRGEAAVAAGELRALVAPG